MTQFLHVQFHRADRDAEEAAAAGIRGARPRGADPRSVAAEENVRFNNDETAARFFLGRILGTDERPALRSLTAPQRPEVVPDLALQRVQESPLTNTRLVSFDQVKTSIPIFGTRATVELDQDRNLVGLSADLAEVPDISPIAELSPAEALRRIAEWTQSELKLEGLAAPRLSFFQQDENGSWHLVYVFEKIPASPPGFHEPLEGHSHGHGLGGSPRELEPEVTYLVDAHDGEIVFHFSNTPLIVASPSTLPARCRGIDEDGVQQDFFGRPVAGGFELFDPFRSIRTFDLGGSDITSPNFPTDAVANNGFDFGNNHQAAVSAHVNAMHVNDFYKGVLMRDGIDDRGMELVSVVNCTYSRHQPPPEWQNAVWWQGRMWYGQESDGARLVSFSRFLDVIAHELTHGVTDHSSNLVYKNQSGALNESFSDIFGIIIKNWVAVGPDSDPGQWNWELGEGLGPGNLPLRDLSDPNRTGDPDHMNDFLVTTADEGGVHTNSNIHNKAAFNVLTAVDGQGNRVFPSREVAILYYLTLTRLSRMATFGMVRVSLLEVARTLYPDPVEQARKMQAIRDSYDAVGIQ